jgi:hypothetical protein
MIRHFVTTPTMLKPTMYYMLSSNSHTITRPEEKQKKYFPFFWMGRIKEER